MPTASTIDAATIMQASRDPFSLLHRRNNEPGREEEYGKRQDGGNQRISQRCHRVTPVSGRGPAVVKPLHKSRWQVACALGSLQQTGDVRRHTSHSLLQRGLERLPSLDRLRQVPQLNRKRTGIAFGRDSAQHLPDRLTGRSRGGQLCHGSVVRGWRGTEIHYVSPSRLQADVMKQHKPRHDRESRVEDHNPSRQRNAEDKRHVRRKPMGPPRRVIVIR
jgi:hypothetical protein